MIEEPDLMDAKKYIIEAEKLKNGWFNKSLKMEKAISLYKKAGLIYKYSKKWKEAGDSYFQAACCSYKQNSVDTISLYVSASKCYKFCSPYDAINSLQYSVDICKECGRFQTAAIYLMSIGEIYESCLVDIQGAIQAYEGAIDLFNNDVDENQQIKCYEKIAIFYTELEQYEKAIDIFVKIATYCQENKKSWHLPNIYILDAGLCQIVQTLNMNNFIKTRVNLKNILQQCIHLSHEFKSSAEYNFLKNIVLSIEAENQDQFIKAIKLFDPTNNKLSSMKLKLLLQIKKLMKANSIC